MNLQPLYSGEVAVYKNIAIGAKWPIFAWGNMAQWAILPQGGPFYPLIYYDIGQHFSSPFLISKIQPTV